MFISRKEYNELVNRIEQLERKSFAHTFDFGTVDLEQLCRKLPKFIDKKIAADRDKLSTAEKS